MAGLGEACTHIAAVLFYIKAAARLQGKQTSIQRKCEWIMPSFLKKVEYLPIKDIDFTSGKGKKRKLDETIDSREPTSSVQSGFKETLKISPSSKEIDTFYEHLCHCQTKPAILSVIPKFDRVYSKNFTSYLS